MHGSILVVTTPPPPGNSQANAETLIPRGGELLENFVPGVSPG